MSQGLHIFYIFYVVVVVVDVFAAAAAVVVVIVVLSLYIVVVVVVVVVVFVVVVVLVVVVMPAASVVVVVVCCRIAVNFVFFCCGCCFYCFRMILNIVYATCRFLPTDWSTCHVATHYPCQKGDNFTITKTNHEKQLVVTQQPIHGQFARAESAAAARLQQ